MSSEEVEAVSAFAAALAAGGIEFVTAFPGSPVTSLALHLEAHGPAHGIEFRWAINENVALSQAFGAAMGGRGAAVLVKHVGVNVAADALQVMGVVHGLAAPLLLIEGADAKPGSSQSAQDNRSLYAGSPQLLVLAPTSPAEIVELVGDACTIARASGMMVVIRGDARCFGSKGPIRLPVRSETASRSPFAPWPERGWALATSARTYASHLELRRELLARLRPWIDLRGFGFGLGADLHVAVVIAGHLGVEVAAAVRARRLPYLRLTIEHPLPEERLLALAARVEALVVLEECTPLLEQQLRALVQRAGLRTKIVGRAELGDARPIGRVEGDALAAMLNLVERRCPPGRRTREGGEHHPGTIPPGPLLEGFAERVDRARLELDVAKPASGYPASDVRKPMFAALRALRAEVFIATDPGITGVLALAEHGCDVKMHMGGAVPIAAGWSRARPGGLAIAVVGDTNLPHSEWLGLLDAIDHRDDVLVVIADNGASEMTQRIVTPRLAPALARASLEAAGLPCTVARVTASLDDPWVTTLRDAAAVRGGPRLVWLEL
ncbi:MAG TPA: thiamine pyrophosphate-dependent enzyme [Enhygromyxa sp.]|nr:thiamine pyrophosphate-dependent enzyme [Enhygromyxa sp.]